MTNTIQSIPLDKLLPHPDNPNRMSEAVFRKLVRNMERSGRYEPLVVRPCRDRADYFQIINGHHRCRALAKLGYKQADCVLWDIDDEQTDILLATLNRLGGSDELGRKMALLKRLNKKIEAGELAKLLPQTAKQIERLTSLKMPSVPAEMKTQQLAEPMVFFVTDQQRQTIEKALSAAIECCKSCPPDMRGKDDTLAARRAKALWFICEFYLGRNQRTEDG